MIQFSSATLTFFTLNAFLPQGLCSRGLFSPLVEFPEWKPLGRGDPLKDPTNEYLPPVLDKVQYWIPGEARSVTQGTTPSTTTSIDRRDVIIHMYRRPPPYRYRPLPPMMLMPPSMQMTTPWPYPEQTTAWRETTEMASTYSEPIKSPSVSVIKAVLLRSSIEKPAPTSTLPPPPPPPPIRATTESLYKHYKQPPPPVKPMYLIIEGHSKVKKYGGAKLDPVSGVPVQETNEVSGRKKS